MKLCRRTSPELIHTIPQMIENVLVKLIYTLFNFRLLHQGCHRRHRHIRHFHNCHSLHGQGYSHSHT